VVHPEEDEISSASQRVREEARGSAARAFGDEQKYEGYHGAVSHSPGQSNTI